MSSTFLVAAVLILFGLLIAAIVMQRRARGIRRSGDSEDESATKRRIFGFPHEEIPLGDRQRSLKVCPDCRELVLLEASACKYCGCALAVEEEKEPDLVLRRVDQSVPTNKRKKDA